MFAHGDLESRLNLRRLPFEDKQRSHFHVQGWPDSAEIERKLRRLRQLVDQILDTWKLTPWCEGKRTIPRWPDQKEPAPNDERVEVVEVEKDYPSLIERQVVSGIGAIAYWINRFLSGQVLRLVCKFPVYVHPVADEIDEVVNTPGVRPRFRERLEEWVKNPRLIPQDEGWLLPYRIPLAEKYAVLAALHDAIHDHDQICLWRPWRDKDQVSEYWKLIALIDQQIDGGKPWRYVSRFERKHKPRLRRVLDCVLDDLRRGGLLKDTRWAKEPAHTEDQPPEKELPPARHSPDKKARSITPKLEWLAKAMLLVKEHPDWSNAQIARETGVDPSTLSRSNEYRVAAALARGQSGDLPHGSKNGETGEIEAWDR